MLLYIALLLTRGLDIVQGQQTEATCSPDFEWAFNSKRQSPCQTAAFLGGACLNSAYSVPAISVGQIYLQPSGSQANACECNTVFYSLISACAQCQDATLITFSKWKSECNESITKYYQFTQSVPNDTSIPSWAFLNLTTDDLWDYFASAENATNGAWVPPQSGPDLSTPAIVGISLGATALVALIIFLLFLGCRQRSQSKGVQFIQYDRIEGSSWKPGALFSASKKVTSYRPGLNFDLVKNRTGDLLELSKNQSQTQSRQSTWGDSVSSFVSKVRAPSSRHEKTPQQLDHHAASSLSSIFTRPKEVRSQVVPHDFDISEDL